MAQEVLNRYNALGGEYDAMVRVTPFLMNCYILYAHCLNNLTKGRRFARVLDVGCGSGLQSVYLADHAAEVVGVDLSLALIRLAKGRCQSHPHARFQVADACRLPFADASFDCIVSYGDVLSHIVEGYEQAVSEMARVARPGALLTLEADTKWNFGILYHPRECLDALQVRGRGHATRVWEGMRFKTFTYSELTGLLEKNGFEMLSCMGHNILASLIPDRYLLETKRTWMGRLALMLGKVDVWLSGRYPFRRFGFNFVVTARKRAASFSPHHV